MSKQRGYWNDYERCYQEALKYKTKTSFHKNSSTAYKYALLNGWLDDYTWFVKDRVEKGYYTKEVCLDKAKQCKSRSEFNKMYPRAYEVAKQNGWLGDYIWFHKPEPKRKWTKELCESEAKKYRYVTEFRKNSPSAAGAAYKNGWMKDYTWFEDGNKIHADNVRKWNKETCYQLAQECVSRSDFKKHNQCAYETARKNGWLEDYTWFRSGFDIFYESGIKWTYENTCEESKKYKSRQEFCDNCVGGYTRALNRGWLDDFVWLEPKLIKEARSAGNCYWVYGYFDFVNKVCYIGLSRDKARHWRHTQKDSKGKYDSVMSYFSEKYGFLPQPTIIENELTVESAREKEAYYVTFFKEKGYKLLNRMKTGSLGGAIVKWDRTACFEEAKKYKKYKEFYMFSKSAYGAARKNGWLSEYVWLERSAKNVSPSEPSQNNASNTE